MDKYIGKRLDTRYEIKELLGSGGMARVYSAYDAIDDRTVAVKILKEEFLGNQDFIRRFKNESKAIAVLLHPNIVKVYDVSFGDRIQYIVMENIDGITLKEYIDQQKKISWKEAVHFTVQILKALQHAHEKGIVHRDIKPQNIMLLKDGTIKVTDFGIARFSRQETRTMTDKAIGSVHYISPEQARGDVTDEKADIYSVGVMLYEMVSGRLPFEADNAVSVAIMQLQADPKPPMEINPNVPEGLQEIVLKAMQKDPNNRYSSSGAMLDAIEMFQHNPSIRFEYKYMGDNSVTKYVDAINSIREARPRVNYQESYAYIDDDNEPRSKKSGAINAILGIGVGLIAFVAFWAASLVFGWFGPSAKEVDIPNFQGMKATDVVNNSNYNFNFDVMYAYDSNKAEGVIIDQDPKSGSKRVREGSKIILTVNSSGTLVSVPLVKGMTEDAAKAKLRESSLLVEVLKVEDDETAVGIVKGSDPQDGMDVVVNSVVRLFVSKGPSPKKVVVPNVSGKGVLAATDELIAKGLKVSEDILREKSSKAKDTVISMDPLPGAEVTAGTAVVLTLSAGEDHDKKLRVEVDLPSSVRTEVNMKVYVDGIVDTESSRTLIPAYSSIYMLTEKGTQGTKKVNIHLNGKPYRDYKFDFDKETVQLMASYPFGVTPSESSTNEPQGD